MSRPTRFIQDIAAGKANSSDLLGLHDGSGYQTISKLTLYHSNITLSGSSAFVSIDPQMIYDGAAWLDARAVQYTNCTVTSHGSANPPYIEVTPDVPAISDIPNLTTELAGKQTSLQIAGEPGVFTGAIQKIHFENSEIAWTPSTGLMSLLAKPKVHECNTAWVAQLVCR
mgnify:CR=1 FL=1